MAKDVKKKKNNTVKIIIGGSIAAAGLIVGVLLYRRNRKQEFPELPDTTVVPSTSSKSSTKNTTVTSPASSAPAAPVPVTATLTKAMAEKIAEEIRKATYINEKDDYGRNWPFLNQALWLIKNVKDYQLVNAAYQEIGFVAKTVVTHLLSTFGQFNAYRQGLSQHFNRMGLKQSTDGKWSLSGLGKPGNVGRGVATTSPIVAVTHSNSKYLIGAGEYIGSEIKREGDVSTVLNPNNTIIYVPSTTLQYI